MNNGQYEILSIDETTEDGSDAHALLVRPLSGTPMKPEGPINIVLNPTASLTAVSASTFTWPTDNLPDDPTRYRLHVNLVANDDFEQIVDISDAAGQVLTYAGTTLGTSDIAPEKAMLVSKLLLEGFTKYTIAHTAPSDTLTITRPQGNPFSAESVVCSERSICRESENGTPHSTALQSAVLEPQILSGAVPQRGEPWTFTIAKDGQERTYRYVAGDNGEKTDIAPLDVEIIDDDASGVVVLPNAETTFVVAEPTNWVVMNYGIVTNQGTATKFTANYGLAEVQDTPVNDTFASAQGLDALDWSKNPDEDIETCQPDSVSCLPYITVKAVGDGQVDWFKFNVPEDPSQIIHLDVDNGYNATEDPLWGTQLDLYRYVNGTLTLVKTADNSNGHDAGTTVYDAYLQHDADLDHTTYGSAILGDEYLLKVSNSRSQKTADREADVAGIPKGVSYDLHVSVTGTRLCRVPVYSRPNPGERERK